MSVPKSTIQLPRLFRSVVVADKGDVDSRSFDHPGLIRPGQEDVPRFLDALKHRAVGSSPDALGCEETDASGSPRFKRGPRLLVPVDDEVRFPGDTAVVDAKQGVDVLVAQVRAEEFAPEEGGIPDDVGRLRPLCLAGAIRLAQIEQSVPALDILQGAEDGITEIREAVR